MQAVDGTELSLLVGYDFETFQQGPTSADVVVTDVSSTSPGKDAMIRCQHLQSCMVNTPAAASICGDAKHNPADEECDDGNKENGDGCSTTCTVENGWFCHLSMPNGAHTCLQGSSPESHNFEAGPSSLSPWTVRRSRQIVAGASVADAGDVTVGLPYRYSGQQGVQINQPSIFKHDAAAVPAPHMWFAADLGVDMSGSRLATWRDQSGNGHHLSAGSGTGPELISDALNGQPVIQFSHDAAGLAASSGSVSGQHTVFAVTKYTANGGGNVVGSADSSFLFGVTGGNVGWYDPGLGWISSPAAQRSTYYAATDRWYMTSAVATATTASLYRDSILMATQNGAAAGPGRLALHDRLQGFSTGARAYAQVAEVIVYDRALSDEEREVVEQYLAQKYDLHGPSAAVCKRRFNADPESFFTSMTKQLADGLTAESFLHIATRVRSQPFAFGTPLMITMFEDNGSTPPSAVVCTAASLCAGKRFYTVCVNGGDTDSVHCDENMELFIDQWQQVMLDIDMKFTSKYGTGQRPNRIHATFGVISCDRAATLWLDDVRLLLPTGTSETASCDSVSATSVGGGTYAQLVMTTMPSGYWTLGDSGSTAVDFTDGKWAIGSTGETGPNLDGNISGGIQKNQPSLIAGSSDPAMTFQLGSQSISVPSFDKVDTNLGFSVALWVQLAAAPSGMVNLVSDWKSADGTWSFRLMLDAAANVHLRVRTHFGWTGVISSTSIPIGTPTHIGGRWEPKSGDLSVWINGQLVSMISDGASTKTRPNIGVPLNMDNPLTIGFDGSTSGAVTAVLDEVTVYRRYVQASDLFRMYHGFGAASFTESGVAEFTIGSGSPISLSAGEDGAILTIVKLSDRSVVETRKFAINDASPSTANAAIGSLTSFLVSSNVKNPDNLVLGAFRARHQDRILLYEDAVDSRVDNRNTDNRLQAGWYYMSSSSFSGYTRSWAGAKQFCENNNMVLCGHNDYCNMGPWPTNGELSTWWSRVEGEGWAPYDALDGSTDRYLSVGLAYRARVCRNYTEVFGSKPGWINSDAPSNTPFACCQRPSGSPGWVQHVQRWHHYASNFSTDVVDEVYVDPHWTYQYGWFESNSWYMTSLKQSYLSQRCTHDVLGMYIVLEQPEALSWTDYSAQVDVYTRYRSLGFIFRWQDADNFYAFVWDGQSRCRSILKFRNGVGSTFARNVGGNPLYAWNWYTIRVDVVGNTFTFWRDQTELFSWTDTTDPIPAGTVGFWSSYNRHTYWNNVKVYNRPPLAGVKTLNSRLNDVGLAGIPIEDEYTGRSVAFGSGLSWAGIGRWPKSTGHSYPSSSPLSNYPFKVFQYGVRPARSSRWGDGQVSVRTLFNCYSQTLLVPENSKIGAYLPLPLRGARDANPSGYRLRSGDSNSIFEVDAYTGQLYVARMKIQNNANSLDFESSTKKFALSTAVSERGWDSGWFTMRSYGSGNEVYREIPLPAPYNTVEPALLDVRVQLMATDGPNRGMIFGSMGSAVRDDSTNWWSQYGGLISGVGPGGRVRIWAPTFHRYGRGALINLGSGSGAMYDIRGNFVREEQVQKSHTGMVRVVVDMPAAPEYDSGWTYHASQRRNMNYEEFEFGWGEWPVECKVYVRPVEGANKGYLFEGRGDALVTDYYGPYGGIIYRWSKNHVAIMAPSRHSGTTEGRMLHIGEGWGGNTNLQSTDEAEIRAMCWKASAPPDFESEWGSVNFYMSENATAAVLMDTLGRPPVKVQVLVKQTSNSWIYPAIPMEQSHLYAYHNGGGVVYAYNQTHVRLWSPSPDPTRGISTSTTNMPLRVRQGWTAGRGNFDGRHVQVKVRAWASYPGVRDSSELEINVRDVAEPPMISDKSAVVNEVVDGVVPTGVVASMSASDSDAGSVLRYSLVSGNDNNAFRIDTTTGQVFVNNVTMVNYELREFFHLGVRVSDGIFNDVAFLSITVRNQNDPIQIFPATMHILENQPFNELVGFPIESADEDWDQSAVYSIVGGNTWNTFKINNCSGQLRVNNTAGLNYEAISEFSLVVRVEDTGTVPTRAETTVSIHLIDDNDAPVLEPAVFNVNENSLGGSIVATLPAFDEDNNTLTFEIALGDRQRYFRVDIDGLYDSSMGLFEGHPKYVLRLTDKVLALGDGSGTDVTDEQRKDKLIMDFEDPNRPTHKFTLQMLVWDDNTSFPLDLRSDDEFYDVNVVDINDRPVLESQAFTINENSPAGFIIEQPVVAEDQDQIGAGRSDALSFALAVGTPGSLPFGIFSNGTIFVKSGANLDFETRVQYLFDVTVTDSGGNMGTTPLTRTDTMAVTVVDLNEPPTVQSLYSYSIEENTPPPFMLAWLNVTDQDVDYSRETGDPLKYEIISGNTNTAFRVTGEGRIHVNKDTINYEAQAEYNIEIRITDPQGAFSIANVKITVIDVNDAPEFVSCPAPELMDSEFEVEEQYSATSGLVTAPGNVGDGSIAFRLGAGANIGDNVDQCRSLCAGDDRCVAFTAYTTAYADAGFRGHCYGRTSASPVYLRTGETGIFAGLKHPICERVNMKENSSPDTPVSAVLQIVDVDGQPFTASIVSADIPAAEFKIVSLGGSDYQIQVDQNVIDFERQSRYLLRVQVTDNGVPSASRIMKFAVYIDDELEPPVFPDASALVVKLDPIGTRVATLAATDPDASSQGKLTYSMTGGSTNTGTVYTDYWTVASNGEVSLIKAMDIASGDYTLQVQCTDEASLSTAATLTIQIVNNNARPVFIQTSVVAARTIAEHSAVGTAVSLPIEFMDEDGTGGGPNGNLHTWAITAVSPPEGIGLFTIEADSTSGTWFGLIKAAVDLNYECDRLAPRAGCPTLYRSFDITVRVRDDGPGNLENFATVTVAVTDVAEAPSLPTNLTFVVPEQSNTDTPQVVGYELQPAGVLPDMYDDDKTPLQFSFTSPPVNYFAVASGNRVRDIALPGLVTQGNSFSNYWPAGQTPRLTVQSLGFDHEVQPEYSLMMKVDDQRDGTSYNIPVRILVADVFERPVPEQAQYHFSVNENMPGGTSLGSVRGTDPDGDAVYYELDEVTMFRYTGDFSKEVPDPNTGQLLKTFKVDLVSGEITLRQPSGGAASVVDFERFVRYDVRIALRDRLPSDGSARLSYTRVNVTVHDVNDVSITAVKKTGTTSALLVTEGNEVLEITGRNYGPEIGDPSLRVQVHYGCAASPGSVPAVSACLFEATSCTVTPNTKITCRTARGHGRNHLVRVQINDHATISSLAQQTQLTPQTLSYAPPSILSVTSLTGPLPTPGGSSVIVRGANFGFGHTRFRVTYGDGLFVASCTLDSHTQLTCTAAEGVGMHHWWIVEVDTQFSQSKPVNLANQPNTSYAPPIIDSVQVFNSLGRLIDANDLRTAGGDVVQFTGRNFGSKAVFDRFASILAAQSQGTGGTGVDPDSLRIVAEASTGQFCLTATCQIQDDSTLIHCPVPPGVGTGYSWMLRVAGQGSNVAPTTTSFRAPVISGISGGQGSSTEGGMSVLLDGSDFGPGAVSPLNPVPTCTYFGHSSARNYSITAHYAVNRTSRGGLPVDRNDWFHSPTCVVAVEHTRLRCTTGIGTGKDHVWVVEIAGQETPLRASSTAYAPPFVTTLTTVAADGNFSLGARTEGFERLIVRGSNFGIDDRVIERVSYGPTGVEFVTTNCTVTEGHVTLLCRTAVGVGTGLSFSVVVDGQESAAPQTRYATPDIARLVGQIDGASTRGGQVINVIGTDFGTANPRYLQDVTFGPQSKYKMRNCSVTTDHTALRCVTPPGIGKGYQWQVNVEGQRSLPSQDIFSYAPPIILSAVTYNIVPPGPGEDSSSLDIGPLSEIPTEGTTLRIVGTNFGTAEDGFVLETGRAQVTKALLTTEYKVVPCSGDEISADNPDRFGNTTVPADAYCVEINVPAGDGANRALLGTSANQQTDRLSYSYGLPRVGQRELQQDSANPLFRVMYMRGNNFGLSGRVFVSTVPVNSSEELRRLYYTQHPSGPGAAPGAVGGDAAARAADVWPGGSYTGEITTDLCFFDAALRLDTIYAYNGAIGRDELRCVIKTIGGKSVSTGYAALEVGVDRSLTSLMVFEELSPRIIKASPMNLPTPGGQIDAIVAYLGKQSDAFSVNMTVGTTDRPFFCRNVRYTELVDTQPSTLAGAQASVEDKSYDEIVSALRCTANCEQARSELKLAHVRCALTGENGRGAGEGKDLEFRVWLGENPSTPLPFSFNPPEFGSPFVSDDASPQASFTPLFKTVGGEFMRLYGRNFGQYPRVYVDGNLIRAVDTVFPVGVYSDDIVMLKFRVPEGVGRGHIVQVEVAGQNSSYTSGGVQMHYKPPSVQATLPEQLVFGTEGGQAVTLLGTNFGNGYLGNLTVQDGLSSRVLYPNIVSWNHTHVMFQMPEWQGKDLVLTVMAADQNTTGIQRIPADGGAPISIPLRVSYLAPSVTGFSPRNGPTSGLVNGTRIIVTVEGENFGKERDVFLGGKRVDLISATHRELKFYLSAGQGARDVRVIAGGQPVMQGDTLFVHDPPVLVNAFSNVPGKLTLSGRTDACRSHESGPVFRARVGRFQGAEPELLERMCCDMETFTVVGNNFGVDSVPRVAFGVNETLTIIDEVCDDTAANQMSELAGCVFRRPCILPGYDHERFMFRGVPGEGVDVPITVHVADLYNGRSRPELADAEWPLGFQATSNVLFDYEAPQIESVEDFPYDSTGSKLVVKGINFGEQGSAAPRVFIDDQYECKAARLLVDTVNFVNNGLPYVICQAESHPAGFHNLTLSVAQQNGTIRDYSGRVKSICLQPNYGYVGEFCLPCPVGGNCSWASKREGAEPISLETFWREELTPADGSQFTDLCPPERQHRPTCSNCTGCPFFSACIPVEACLANNTCAEGYTAVRCSECVRGTHYRSGGVCVECPDRMWLIIFTFCITIIGLAALGFVMNKYRMNMATISMYVSSSRCCT